MGKFNANSLSYSQNLPAFLAKLQGQYNDDRNGQRADPILATQRRAAKKRSASEEAEDAPLILDDNGNVMAGVTVDTDGTATMDNKDKYDEAGTTKRYEKTSTSLDGVAGIGAGKKKRLGRVIGGESDNDSDNSNSTDRRKRKRRFRDNDVKSDDGKARAKVSEDGGAIKKATSQGSEKDNVKKKKKARKIQLSFEDEDEG
ncbi:uncharacterized protein SPSK_03647 [Sporothrix schenckii 1099-18]|uniref:DUF4604 domain-containing protein n=2 Tax=Sporothrix schenckii TaxID=29908 RepID=U7PP62_SPOS1|nr:uncharacterized protein SPSK_03647 [Sporothrix schenckii 1099-18]ERS97398.1 hypothetical protein HMPREF1624_05565 [Sporothrix schenckii ATCC 58251]KJR81891.1 hypothetical protein SPSK_03647 [Sporothrix schenckii 1099-18]